MYNRIVVATDGSELSMRAAEQAMKFAKLVNAKLSIVYVIDQRVFFFPHEVQELAAENPYFKILEDLRKNAQQVNDTLLKKSAKNHVKFDFLVKEGTVIDEIIRVIEEIKGDLLVIGAHGKTGEARGVLGSTAQAMNLSAPCSVLTVRF